MSEEILLAEVEKVFKSIHVKPELLKKITEYVKSSAINERDYYKTRVLEFNKELNSIKSKLDKLMDFYLEDKLTEAEYEEKRSQLVTRRDSITDELEAHNKADDNFNERMIDVINLAANAHQIFLQSTNEKKRQLIKLVLSTVKMNGRKLEYILRPPFDMFVNLSKNKEWRALEDSNL